MPVNLPLLLPIARLLNTMAARLRTIRESVHTAMIGAETALIYVINASLE
jgi:hypothetical protein